MSATNLQSVNRSFDAATNAGRNHHLFAGSKLYLFRESLRPQMGGMRAFTGSKYVTLDWRTPRASVDFELYYALPRSDGPR